MVYCDNCGVSNEDDAVACYSCGRRPVLSRAATQGSQQSTSAPTSGSVQPSPYPAPMQPYSDQQVGFRCPYCKSPMGVYHWSKTSTGGIITIVLLLLFCFPLFWIGFFITENHTSCLNCRMQLT
jgi:hypothetical protein